MTTIDHIRAAVDSIDDQIAELQLVRDELGEVLARLASPVSDLAPAAVTPVVEPPPPADDAAGEERRAKDRERKRKARSGTSTPTRKADQVACPDCGAMFHPNGLGPHRSAKHPKSAAKPVTPIAPAKHQRDNSDVDEVFTCADCGEERATTEGLSEHTYANHGRPTKFVERNPKAAVA